MIDMYAFDYKPKILSSVNIKTRRLAYIRQITEILKNGEKLQKRNLIADLEKWSIENKNYLDSYIINTGFISSSSDHTPANRYIDLTEEMNLITKIGNELTISKFGTVLTKLNRNDNPFFLSTEEICFFLKHFLTIDAETVIILFNSFNESSFQQQSEIQKKFLEEQKKYLSSIKISFESREYDKLIKRIERWKSPEKYSEHLVPPRVEWLLDLNLLDNKRVSNKKLLYRPNSNFYSFISKVKQNFNNDMWYENDFYQTFYDIFIDKKYIRLEKIPEVKKNKILIDFLEKSFKLFTTELTPRPQITASQFLEYTCIKLMTEKNIIAGFDDLKKMLINLTKIYNKYRFHWSNDINDGYIIKI